MKKLAIICTHPIQYYAPLFKLLAAHTQIAVKVFYTWGEASLNKYDPGFNKSVEWDIPLLEGYTYTFLPNSAKRPGSSHFMGIVNPNLILELSAYEPSAILVFGWAYHSHLQTIRHFKGKIPIWFRGDSTLLGKSSKLKHFLRAKFLKWVYKHVDLAFYVGTENKKYYQQFGLESNQLVFAPHAVDNQRFMDSENHIQQIRCRFNIKEEAAVVLFAGKFEKVKNPELLLKAFINTNLTEAHLILVGNGPLERNLRAIADAHPNIHFPGFQNQSLMPSYYYAADLFCLPSLSETWGLAVNEAMACGKAVLTSNKVACATDLIEAEVNGDIFESDSVDALTSKLSKLLKDKHSLKIMGAASRELIQNWSLESTCKAITEQLLSLNHGSRGEVKRT